MMSWSVVGVMELSWNTRSHISMDIFWTQWTWWVRVFWGPKTEETSCYFGDGIPGSTFERGWSQCAFLQRTTTQRAKLQIWDPRFPQKNESRPSSPHLRVDAVFVPSILLGVAEIYPNHTLHPIELWTKWPKYVCKSWGPRLLQTTSCFCMTYLDIFGWVWLSYNKH
jgi:hypothetical protein